jgi:hypothetical protein
MLDRALAAFAPTSWVKHHFRYEPGGEQASSRRASMRERPIQSMDHGRMAFTAREFNNHRMLSREKPYR